MTLKLGDKVNIQAHYRKSGVYIHEEDINIDEIYNIEDKFGEGLVKVIDEGIPWIEVQMLFRQEDEESGVICGVRYRTTKIVFQVGRDTEWGYEEGVHIEERTKRKLYMVATRMNTIRLVGEEDVELNL